MALRRRQKQQHASYSQGHADKENNDALTKRALDEDKKGREKANRKGEASEDSPSERSVARSTWVIAILTGGLVFSSVVSAVISYYQWKEIHEGSVDTHKLAKATEIQATAMEESERPRIGMFGASFTRVPAPGKSYIQYAIQNLGRGYGVVRAIFSDCYVSAELPVGPKISPEHFRNIRISMAPSSQPISSSEIGSCEIQNPIDDQSMAEISSGQQSVFFRFVMAYDGFGERYYVDSRVVTLNTKLNTMNFVGGTLFNFEKKIMEPFVDVQHFSGIDEYH